MTQTYQNVCTTTVKDMAARGDRGWETLIQSISDQGDIPQKDAEAVATLYNKNRLLTVDRYHGTYRVKHGALLEKSTILNARDIAYSGTNS